MSRLILNEQASTVATPAASKVALYVDNTATPIVKTVDDLGTVKYQTDSLYMQSYASIASVSAGYASDTYLAGSTCTIPLAGGWLARAQYQCDFDMTKTAAGTAAFTIIVRMGTLGTTSDAAILTLAYAVGTAAADTGLFTVRVNFRTVGSGTSAVIQGISTCVHHLAATGLITTGASGTGIILSTSSGFNSTTQTKIGLSVNGSTSFSGTNTLVQARLLNPGY
jgi:hypothetical protein